LTRSEVGRGRVGKGGREEREAVRGRGAVGPRLLLDAHVEGAFLVLLLLLLLLLLVVLLQQVVVGVDEGCRVRVRHGGHPVGDVEIHGLLRRRRERRRRRRRGNLKLETKLFVAEEKG